MEVIHDPAQVIAFATFSAVVAGTAGPSNALQAWRIATAGHAEEATSAPAGFLGMAAFQWVNPKGWLVGVAAIATFPDRRADGGAPACHAR
jgi:threonine/homoserine/homoserine lactone efflux protein